MTSQEQQSEAISTQSQPAARRRGRELREILLYGACLGVLTIVLDLADFRFLGAERSVQLYAGVVAVVFAAVGIWLGLRLRSHEPPRVIEVPVEVPTAGPFVRDERRLAELGITPRELEILELIAAGLSNREIAEKLFVSENTVKTHASRVFDKLGARRRTEAVQLAKTGRLIP